MKRAELIRAAATLFFLMIVSGSASGIIFDANAQTRTGQRVACVDGAAAGYNCSGIDLLSVLSLEDAGSPLVADTLAVRYELNDMWGWFHEESGREFALVGRQDGTSFIDVTDPLNPVLVGTLPSHSTGNRTASGWRDIKVHADHAFIVADNFPGHGMQVFDLTRLLPVEGPPVVFTEDAHYEGVSSVHNLFINEDTGFAYLVGARGFQACGGSGLHVVDVRSPTEPVLASCFSDPDVGGYISKGYTHDVQCVVYDGPDEEYMGREICVTSSETVISVVDMTDKDQPATIGIGAYPDVGYVHQGWLDDEHRYFYQNDELNEVVRQDNQYVISEPMRSYVWDLTDLDDPVLATEYESGRMSIDHNNYVVGDHLVQSNYIDGLVIVDIADRENPGESGYFDVHPSNAGIWDGSWSNYPYFRSGAIGVTSSIDGFFMVMPTIPGFRISTASEALPRTASLLDVYPNPFPGSGTVEFEVDRSQRVRLRLFDVLGREVLTVFDGRVTAGMKQSADLKAGSLPAGVYVLKMTGADFVTTRTVILTR